MRTLQDKVSIVTGATSGIGKAAALALGREGSTVVVSGRREAEGMAVVDQIKAEGGQAVFVKADVTRESEVENLVSEAVRQFGRLDVAFLNSGVFRFSPLAEQTSEDLSAQIDTNIKGAYYGVKHASKALGEGGSIILNSSVVGSVGIPNASAYSLTKGAVDALARSAATELAPRNIRVNAIAPGPIWTEGAADMTGSRENFDTGLGSQTALGRGGEAHEIADAVVFLAGGASSFITGQIIAVDGGFSAK